MPDIVLPRLNANDDTYVLLEWLVPSGATVAAGDCVATVETSKAVSDLMAEASGCLVHRVPAGATCRPGEVVGAVSAAGTPPEPADLPAPDAPAGRDEAPPTGPTITRSARELMDRHGVTVAAVAALGRRVVKRADVAALLSDPAEQAAGGTGAPAASDRRIVPSAHQRAIARTVTTSHETIPAAFTVVKVSATEAIGRLRRIGRQPRAFIGIPELVVKAVADLHATHPTFFAGVGPDLVLEPAHQADIGVTIDVGTGLFVPVIRDAARLDVIEVGQRLMDFRLRAMRRALKEEDLANPALTVSLHTDPGVVLARAIIHPGQSCALSLCALQQEPRLDPAGQLVSHEFFHTGLAYDHRVVNGREAADFLTALRLALETPDGDALALETPDGDA